MKYCEVYAVHLRCDVFLSLRNPTSQDLGGRKLEKARPWRFTPPCFSICSSRTSFAVLDKFTYIYIYNHLYQLLLRFGCFGQTLYDFSGLHGSMIGTCPSPKQGPSVMTSRSVIGRTRVVFVSHFMLCRNTPPFRIISA